MEPIANRDGFVYCREGPDSFTGDLPPTYRIVNPHLYRLTLEEGTHCLNVGYVEMYCSESGNDLCLISSDIYSGYTNKKG